MLISKMIFEKEKKEFEQFLKENNFNKFYNRYAPFSMFYTKELKGNKTLYVRNDIELINNITYYQFEIWVRDNTKDILAKDIDQNLGLFRTKIELEELKYKILGILRKEN